MRGGLLLTIGLAAALGWAQEPAAVEAIRAYALHYSQSLPDYTCLADTQRVENSERAGTAKSEAIEEEISYIGEAEHYKVLKVDGKAAKGVTHEQLGGATSAGEFGGLLKQIFDPQSATAFSQQSSGKLNGRAVAVLKFRVAQPTGYAVYDNVSKNYIRVAFDGTVWADAGTNAVMKIAIKLVDIPKESPLEETAITLEYKAADLSGQQFILPWQFEWNWRGSPRGGTQGQSGTSVIRFSKCRKFTAESNIDFGK